MYTPTDEEVRQARYVLEQDYFADVERVAEEFVENWRTGEFADRDSAIEWLDETTDGHGRVIYNVAAGECLTYSNNPDAYDEEIGGEASINARACLAFRADIIARINEMGVDVNDEPVDRDLIRMGDELRAAFNNGDVAVTVDEEESTVNLDMGLNESAAWIEVALRQGEWNITVEGLDAERDLLSFDDALAEAVRLVDTWKREQD